MPIGVESPVFWGSFAGVLIGSLMAGVSYLSFGVSTAWLTELLGADPQASRPVVVVFCCLLCVRYYASIVFLTYDDTASPTVRRLELRARRYIFLVQIFLILGCSVNIAVLPVLGSAAATIVIILQGASVAVYWRWLWRALLVEDKEADFNVVKLIADAAILVSAVMFFLWEVQVFEYNETGAGMCMGMLIIVFLIECATTYRKSLRTFLKATVAFLE